MKQKLFIPGPIQVSEKTYKAMTTPVMGHRSKDFVALYAGMQPQLKELFFTKDPVYISTSSSFGIMEGAVNNVCKKGVLNCGNGAFADKWHDVSKRNGKNAGLLSFDWGKPVCPEAVRKELSTGKYDCITLVHNETSTGTMTDLKAVMEVIREFPDVISIVDTVSSFTALPIEKDALGVDVMVTGCQKALALPPGLSFCVPSQRALDRAKEVENRGYYFDFLEFQANYEKNMTPSTPVITLMFALQSKLEDIFEEGLANRYARHSSNNELIHNWGFEKGFELFPEAQYASKSLTCFKNNLDIDVAGFVADLKAKTGMIIDGGYGKIKGKTFRISNMGDETAETMQELISCLDSVIVDYLK
ncbi:MAG: alanine--glyoxylate aminotransferase family protein [Opitutales bacterium]